MCSYFFEKVSHGKTAKYPKYSKYPLTSAGGLAASKPLMSRAADSYLFYGFLQSFHRWMRFEPPKLFRCKATGKIRTWGRMHQHTAAYSIADETKSCLWCGGFEKKFFQDYLCKSLQSTVTWQQSDPKPTIRLCESWTTFTRKGNLKKLRPVESYAGSKVKIRMQSKIPSRFGPGKAVPWPHFVQSTNVLWICLFVLHLNGGWVRLGGDLWTYLGVVAQDSVDYIVLISRYPLVVFNPQSDRYRCTEHASIKQGQAGSLQWSLQVLRYLSWTFCTLCFSSRCCNPAEASISTIDSNEHKHSHTCKPNTYEYKDR